MALTGLSAVAGYAGPPSGRANGQALLGRIAASENIQAAGVSTIIVPSGIDADGDPVWQLRCAVDAWVAFGSAPNAGANPRVFLPANTTETFYAIPGHKVAWAAA